MAMSTLPSVEEIRDASESRLRAVLAQLKSSLDVTSRTLTAVVQAPILVEKRKAGKEEAPDVLVAEAAVEPPKELTGLDLAFAQVRAREQALRASIAAASEAAPEDIAAAQAQVAMNYEAYSLALVVAQAAVRSAVPSGVNPETTIATR